MTNRFIDLRRDEFETYMITPNSSYSETEMHDRLVNYKDILEKKSSYKDNLNKNSGMLFNFISGIFSEFYAPERIRFSKDKIKMNDVISYRVMIENGVLKFYFIAPKKWIRGLISTIKHEWDNVDATKVDNDIFVFDEENTRGMKVQTIHHYCLSLKNDDKYDSFYSSLASLASTLKNDERVLIDYNIEPTNDKWKSKATKKIREFENGKIPAKEDFVTFNGIIGKILDTINIIMDEFLYMIEGIMSDGEDRKDDKINRYDTKYSKEKLNANSKGYKVQIRVLCESKNENRLNYSLKNIQNSFELLNGDNKFTTKIIKTKRGVKAIINNVENNRPSITDTSDLLYEKELFNILKLPNKKTLREYGDVIMQDNFTRTEIDEDFKIKDNGAIPFAKTLDKNPEVLYFGGYKREWWDKKGRYVKEKTRLDDRTTATMVIGKQGSGKTSLSESQALYTFGTHLSKDEWVKESKSVVVFDVADGEMVRNIYNHVPEWLLDRVVILNHGNFNNPISVNNSDLNEFNKMIMRDDDYSYTLAEMEAKLMLEILESEKSISVDRWFISALQAVHSINDDWGYIEAMRVLTDDEFRAIEVIPNIKNNKRLKLEIESFHNLAVNGKALKIIQTIENRFSQLERDQKLWDCIAQKPLRNADGMVKLNFRKLMDGDENGAYLILIHIPKSGVSSLYRRFVFAQYFTKIWNVALSRESGFGGREYRPETLVIIDEIHQILNIPLVAKLFIDLFKEPRKYSLRLWLTLHGFSSFATAGRAYESAIKQSILDNGCNLVMLKGGSDSFDKLSEFLSPLTIMDYNNLMNTPFTGIFSIHWKSKMHVFQAKLIEHISKNKDFKKYRELDSEFLSKFNSEYGVSKNKVRDDNLERAHTMIENSIASLEKTDEDMMLKIQNFGRKQK